MRNAQEQRDIIGVGAGLRRMSMKAAVRGQVSYLIPVKQKTIDQHDCQPRLDHLVYLLGPSLGDLVRYGHFPLHVEMIVRLDFWRKTTLSLCKGEGITEERPIYRCSGCVPVLDVRKVWMIRDLLLGLRGR